MVQNFRETKRHAELKSIVDDYTSDGGSAAIHSKVAQMKDKAIAVCAAHGCLTIQHCNVKQVGGTPMNRDNEGIKRNSASHVVSRRTPSKSSLEVSAHRLS